MWQDADRGRGWRHTEDHRPPAMAEQPHAVSIASCTPVASTATSKRAPSSAPASVTAWAAPSRSLTLSRTATGPALRHAAATAAAGPWCRPRAPQPGRQTPGPGAACRAPRTPAVRPSPLPRFTSSTPMANMSAIRRSPGGPLAVHFIKADPYPPRAGLRILVRQTGDSPGRSICAPVISPATARMAFVTGFGRPGAGPPVSCSSWRPPRSGRSRTRSMRSRELPARQRPDQPGEPGMHSAP